MVERRGVDAGARSRSMTIAKAYVGPPGNQVHYRSAGAGTKVLVLVHQIPSSSAMWEQAMPLFADRGYRVLAPDLPGYGMSDPQPAEPDLEVYGRSMFEFLERLEVGPAFLFGHHTGGSIALTMVVQRPDRVVAAAVWGFALVGRPARDALANEPTPNYDDDGKAVQEWWTYRLGLCTAPNRSHVMARSVAELLLAEEHAPDGHRAVARADHEELLRRLTRPVLIMAGDRELLLEGSRKAPSFSGLVEYEHLGGQGMDVADAEPDLLVRTVDAFFSRSGRAAGHPE
jgi:pimeloyl-ACP methyl ester carboxylesterase